MPVPLRFPKATKPQRDALTPFVEYLRTHRNRRGQPLSEQTQGLYAQHVLVAMRKAKTTDPARLIVWLTTDRINPRTPYGTAQPLLAALTHYFAQAEGRVPDASSLPYLGALTKGSRDALSEAELKRFCAVVRESSEDVIPTEQGVAILLLLPATGLRISEACALRRCDVNRKGPGVWGLDVLGKGSKVRRVPLNAFDDEALDVLREYDAAVVKGRGTTSEAPLFPSPRSPDFPISKRTIEYYLRRLRALYWPVNDDDEFHGQLATVECHTLRHTCATRLLRAGVPIHIVQRLLGHSTLATTERYSHPTDSDVADALGRSR